MIQDIYPHSFDNTFKSCGKIQDNDYIFCYNGNSLLLKKENDSFELPIAKDLFGPKQLTGTFLFSLNETNCFLIEDCSIDKNSLLEFVDINNYNTIDRKEITWLSILGLQIKKWYDSNKFCGKCGTPTNHKNDERALVCPN